MKIRNVLGAILFMIAGSFLTIGRMLMKGWAPYDRENA